MPKTLYKAVTLRDYCVFVERKAVIRSGRALTDTVDRITDRNVT